MPPAYQKTPILNACAVQKIGTDSYITAWGPNEYTPIGNLSNYEYRDKLKNIKEPALIINGTNDLCTPLVAKTMYDSIPNSRWELLMTAVMYASLKIPTAIAGF